MAVVEGTIVGEHWGSYTATMARRANVINGRSLRRGVGAHTLTIPCSK